MSGIGEPSSIMPGEEDLTLDPFENVPQEFKDAADKGKDAVMSALEDPRAVVNGWRAKFEEEVGDVTEPNWVAADTQEESDGAEIIPFPSTAQTPEAQAEYRETTLVPESDLDALDTRLAS